MNEILLIMLFQLITKWFNIYIYTDHKIYNNNNNNNSK